MDTNLATLYLVFLHTQYRSLAPPPVFVIVIHTKMGKAVCPKIKIKLLAIINSKPNILSYAGLSHLIIGKSDFFSVHTIMITLRSELKKKR